MGRAHDRFCTVSGFRHVPASPHIPFRRAPLPRLIELTCARSLPALYIPCPGVQLRCGHTFGEVCLHAHVKHEMQAGRKPSCPLCKVRLKRDGTDIWRLFVANQVGSSPPCDSYRSRFPPFARDFGVLTIPIWTYACQDEADGSPGQLRRAAGLERERQVELGALEAARQRAEQAEAALAVYMHTRRGVGRSVQAAADDEAGQGGTAVPAAPAALAADGSRSNA